MLVRQPAEVAAVLESAAQKLSRVAENSERLTEIKTELVLLFELVGAWVSGAYRSVSIATIVSILAAIIYFVVPLDLIPDFILGLGMLDDVAVIGYVVNSLREEISNFSAWKVEQAEQPPGNSESGQETG